MTDETQQAPDAFKVRFDCSNGAFTVECHKAWAPLGVQRFHELVTSGFYDGARFFRVVPGFVVQFGMAGDPAVHARWSNAEIADDPVIASNEPGSISFASRGPGTRTTQVFINYENNARLDGMGFAPFGRVVEGMEIVEAITAEYGQDPDQHRISTHGNAYLQAEFPNLDYIKQATLLP